MGFEFHQCHLQKLLCQSHLKHNLSTHSTPHIMTMLTNSKWYFPSFIDQNNYDNMITFDNFQSRTWGRRRLMFFEFSLIPQQASLRASTLGNHHQHHNHLCHHHHPHHHQHPCSRCYHNDPFRYQMPANVKKRAITAGLIGEQSDIFDPNIDSFPNIWAKLDAFLNIWPKLDSFPNITKPIKG